jgi:hypothetical protein
MEQFDRILREEEDDRLVKGIWCGCGGGNNWRFTVGDNRQCPILLEADNVRREQISYMIIPCNRIVIFINNLTWRNF